MYLTREQRLALKRVYDRCPIDADHNPVENTGGQPIGYRQFRRSLSPLFDCVVVRWCGMWLGIEADGYTHS